MKIARALLASAALAAALLAGGCTPQEGASCNSKGEYYTHTDNGKTISLTCTQVGPDRYEWRKA